MNAQLQAAKIRLEEIIVAGMAGYKLSDIAVERTKIMVDLAKPYIKEELIEPEVIMLIADKFSDPQAFLSTSRVVDGVIYPLDSSSELMDEVIEGFSTAMNTMPEEGAATVAAITVWTSEAMLREAA